ncbi:MAG TPA: hypothetical protein VF625_11155, partial [Longimicrobium sp.]
RSAIPEWGADSRMSSVSDWLFWVDVAHHGKIGYVEEVLTRYRMHPGNMTKRGDVILAEQLMMLAIVEGRYPEYLELIPNVRAECLWYHGLRYLAEGDTERARTCFRRSFHDRFLTFNVSTAHKGAILLLMSVGKLDAALPVFGMSQRMLGRLRRGRAAGADD